MRRRLHRRLVRTSTFAGSSSPSSIGTPSPTSPTVIFTHATRSDQLMCVIHPAPVTSILVERALHRARRAVAASPLRAAVASPPWSSPPLLPYRRRPRLRPLVDSSLCSSRMVFVKLYEFFAVSFERRRRVIRIIQPRAGKSGSPSLRLAQPHRQRRHLVPDYFVYSSNSRRWRLLPRLLLHLRPPWRPSLLVPPATAFG